MDDKESYPQQRKKVNVPRLLESAKNGVQLTMVTAYDATMGALVDAAGVDIVLVGDSLGVVVQGEASTIYVTLEQMIYHTSLVAKGVRSALIVADMPFMSYQTSLSEALCAAGRLLKEGRAEAVKLEGGRKVTGLIKRMVRAGIPVMGHLGLEPQLFHMTGGYSVKGRTVEERRMIIEDAQCLEKAGCFAVVLECIPEELGKEVSEAINIPTVGIGAGRYTGGQVLVFHDLLGLSIAATGSGHKPKFVRDYAQLGEAVISAITHFRDDVRAGNYPQEEHVYFPLSRVNLASEEP